MNEYLDISPEVKAALSAGKPVVTLESTIISPRHALTPKCGNGNVGGKDHPG